METFQENIIKLELTIPNFSIEFIEENREVCSRSVINYDFEGKKSEWHLVFYPDGRDYSDEGYISLFLELLDSEKSDLDVRYRLFLVDAENNEVFAKASETNYAESCGWGWSQFARQEDVFDNGMSLFPYGILRIGCEFTVRNQSPLPKIPKYVQDQNFINEQKVEKEKLQEQESILDTTLFTKIIYRDYKHIHNGYRLSHLLTGLIAKKIKNLRYT